ncbi:MAG TPA: hypothetical protein VI603_04025 [Saprospiraceae bacterium]|nr:hypothetical protein [Saprospiraceae bacterium]
MTKSNFLTQSLLPGIFVGFLTFSCKQSTESTESGGSPDSTKYTLTAFGPSQDYPDALITKMEYRNGRFTFEIAGESYKLGMQTPDAAAKGCANSAEGQHIHLIVDNMPYVAKYESTFDYDVPDGEHYILAFLSRSYHESLKARQAAIAIKATVKDKNITQSSPISEPMVFYSRPKGAYDGEADTRRVMLDYYLINPDASHRVQATINGEVHMLSSWQPYYIEGLPAGENKITLTLVDPEGKRVNTDLNPVTRKFVLNPEPPAN